MSALLSPREESATSRTTMFVDMNRMQNGRSANPEQIEFQPRRFEGSYRIHQLLQAHSKAQTLRQFLKSFDDVGRDLVDELECKTWIRNLNIYFHVDRAFEAMFAFRWSGAFSQNLALPGWLCWSESARHLIIGQRDCCFGDCLREWSAESDAENFFWCKK